MSMDDICHNHGLDLENMEWADAVREARARCQKTNELIAREFSALLGISKPYPMSTVQRWFNSNDRKYWPSAEYVPKLCRVLGNHLLIAWMVAQAKRDPDDGQVMTMDQLREFLPAIVAEFGNVGSALMMLGQNPAPVTAKGVRGAITAFVSRLLAFRRLLNPLARRGRRSCARA